MIQEVVFNIHLSSFLWIGATLPFCHSEENLPVTSLKMISRGGYRFRQVRQMTYFPFNRHNFMRLNASNKCPLGNCDNKYKMIDYCLGLGLWLSASLIRFHGNSSDQKIFSWCFLEKKKLGFQSQFKQQY